MKPAEKILSAVQLHIYEQLLARLKSGEKTTMINLFNSGIIVDINKIGKKALETIIKMGRKRAK